MNAINGIGAIGRRQGGADTRRMPGALPILLLTAFLVALALSAVAAGSGVLAWDVTAARFIQRVPEAFAGDAARIVSALGDTPVMVPLGGALVVALVALRHIGSALFLMAAGLACAANPVLKWMIESPRPTGDLVRVTELSPGQGFPSGHVMKVVLVYGAILLISRTVLTRRGPRLAVQTWAAGMIVATGVSRIYVGAHWPSDVVGAYLWSGLLLGLVVVGYRRLSAVEFDTTIRGGTRMHAVQFAVINRSRRIGVLAAGVLFAVALAAALAGSLAAQEPLDDRTWPAQIRASACEQLGDVAHDLNLVGAARSDDEDNEQDDLPGGDYVGAAGAVQVATSGTELRVNLDELLAQPHAIVVTTAADDDTVVACGEIGGYLRGSDDLFIGLKAHEGSGVTGVALLDGDDGNEVEVTIYLTAGAAAPAASPAA